ncbi:ketopantoate reductase family protein [Alteromonas stellipolaris]|uniref:ketopantoate reductase family protein n=1 Tax=Alteromonas stellipolaris TaxID=233316 RepID=UPI001DF9D99E|nr:2-dehydropantoate 2-reductase [Alteromonas stellipolaris]MBZ2162521.1 2-dehydropantoate 2-reductase [Alteromonas stellipolaris]
MKSDKAILGVQETESVKAEQVAIKKIHIAGRGAIGSLLAGAAEKQTMPYALYPRSPVSQVDKSGFQKPSLEQHNGELPKTETPTRYSQHENGTPTSYFLEWIDGTAYPVTQISRTKPHLFDNDILVLPLKVHHLKAALTQWLPFLGSNTPVVLLHNGMGGYEIAKSLLPSGQPLLLATTSHGAMKRTATQVIYTGVGATQVGIAPHLLSHGHSAIPEWAKSVCHTLHALLPPVKYQTDIMQALWAKLAINVVINPLTALNNITNSHIASEQFANQRKTLCEEFTLVANACGQCFDAIKIEQQVIKVASLTGNNYSSMHQDVKNQRQTEIEAINGYIVNMAQKKGIEVPLNTLLTKQITARLT